MLADDTRISVTVATVEFHETGGSTELVLTEQGVYLDGHETPAQRAEGTRSLLDSLAGALAEGDAVTGYFAGENHPMRTVASFIFISLDGFYEGPNGELDWPNVDEEFNDFAVRQLDEADTLGFGRATYEHMAAYWPTEQAMANDPAITARMNEKEKLVFSTTLSDASWSGTTVVRSDAIEHVRGMHAARGKELLVLGSAHLTAKLARAGVLDELRIMIFPIVLGPGEIPL